MTGSGIRVPAGARGSLVGPLLATALLSAATIVLALQPSAPLAPEPAERPEDQTFLTYPEWFLVFSPDEYARYLATSDSPSRFPFMGHVAQLWQGYSAVARETARYTWNGGYHLMIVVIATSTTVEYALKGAYEALVGRAFEALRASPTREDRFAATVAREYVDFIEVSPWYQFDFGSRLARLWSLPLAFDANTLRALERRFALSSELGAKALYGQLIAAGTGAAYLPASPITEALVERLPHEPNCGGVTITQVTSTDRGIKLKLPRYQAFTDCVCSLAEEGIGFIEIAANRGPIALTAIVPDNWRPPSGAALRPLFAQPVLTEPGTTRALLVTTVPQLDDSVRLLQAAGARIEHVFDF